MSDVGAFIGEIRYFAGQFTPRQWAICGGQILPISGYDALFSLLGTQYGGDGRVTFNLPDLRGRVAVGRGTGPGLKPYVNGEMGGTELVTLDYQQMPTHTHAVSNFNISVLRQATTETADLHIPETGAVNAAVTAPPGNPTAYVAPDQNTFKLGGAQAAASGASGDTGGDFGHYNLAPFLTLTPIICLEGIYPSRN